MPRTLQLLHTMYIMSTIVCSVENDTHNQGALMPFDRPSPPLTFWTIAGAVATGILIAHIVEGVAIATWARIQLERAAVELNKAAEASRQQQLRFAQDQAARAAAAEQARRAEIQRQADAQRAAAAAQAAAIEAQQRKQAAWERYYTPPAVCANPPDNAVFTSCANEHLRKKTQFEATYRP